MDEVLGAEELREEREEAAGEAGERCGEDEEAQLVDGDADARGRGGGLAGRRSPAGRGRRASGRGSPTAGARRRPWPHTTAAWVAPLIEWPKISSGFATVTPYWPPVNRSCA